MEAHSLHPFIYLSIHLQFIQQIFNSIYQVPCTMLGNDGTAGTVAHCWHKTGMESELRVVTLWVERELEK